MTGTVFTRKRASNIWTSLLALTLWTPCVASDSSQSGADREAPRSSGPYLDQTKPGATPSLFAPGIVSRDIMNHSSPTFSSDGREVYWSEFLRDPLRVRIVCSRLVDGVWTAPEPIDCASTDSYGDDCPFLAPNGARLFFASFRNLPGETGPERERLWYADRDENGWSQATPLGPAINNQPLHWQASVSEVGTLYLSSDVGILVSRLVDGHYQPPQPATEVMHKDYRGITPFIAPDESYIIFASSDLGGAGGRKDLYIGYRLADDRWSEPIRLSDRINGEHHDLCPIVSPDRQYLFYVSMRPGREAADVYWVRADFLEELRPPSTDHP